jgi:hypothetical protein
MNTNVYFAGNNATADSEEGALDSALALANYAFGVEYPLAKFSGESLFAYFMYTVYHNVMFPKQNAGHAIASMFHTLPSKEKMTTASTSRVALVAKKKSTVKKAKPKAAKKSKSLKTTVAKAKLKKAKPAKKKIVKKANKTKKK